MPRSSQTPQPARDELFLNLPDSLWLSRRDALLDAYRAEVLREARAEVVTWLAKKAGEEATWDAGVLASKVDRGAIRLFPLAEDASAVTS